MSVLKGIILLNVHRGEEAYSVGTGTRGGRGGRVKTGVQSSLPPRQAPTRKTKDAVDCRQNNRLLRQCSLGIAQQLVYYAIAVLTDVRNRVTKTMSVVTYY